MRSEINQKFGTLFTVESEKSRFDLYEETPFGPTIVAFGDKKVRCQLHQANCHKDKITNIPDFLAYKPLKAKQAA